MSIRVDRREREALEIAAAMAEARARLGPARRRGRLPVDEAVVERLRAELEHDGRCPVCGTIARNGEQMAGSRQGGKGR